MRRAIAAACARIFRAKAIARCLPVIALLLAGLQAGAQTADSGRKAASARAKPSMRTARWRRPFGVAK